MRARRLIRGIRVETEFCSFFFFVLHRLFDLEEEELMLYVILTESGVYEQ